MKDGSILFSRRMVDWFQRAQEGGVDEVRQEVLAAIESIEKWPDESSPFQLEHLRKFLGYLKGAFNEELAAAQVEEFAKLLRYEELRQANSFISYKARKALKLLEAGRVDEARVALKRAQDRAGKVGCSNNADLEAAEFALANAGL